MEMMWRVRNGRVRACTITEKRRRRNLFIFIEEKFLPCRAGEAAPDRVANFLGKIFRQIAEFQLRTLVSDDDGVTSRVIVDAVVRSHSRTDHLFQLR